MAAAMRVRKRWRRLQRKFKLSTQIRIWSSYQRRQQLEGNCPTLAPCSQSMEPWSLLSTPCRRPHPICDDSRCCKCCRCCSCCMRSHASGFRPRDIPESKRFKIRKTLALVAAYMMHSSSVEQGIRQESRAATRPRSTVVVVADVSVSTEPVTAEGRSIAWTAVAIVARIGRVSIVRARSVICGLVIVAARSVGGVTRIVGRRI